MVECRHTHSIWVSSAIGGCRVLRIRHGRLVIGAMRGIIVGVVPVTAVLVAPATATGTTRSAAVLLSLYVC